MATHSSILAWEIPWTEGAWWVIVHVVTKSVRHNLETKQPQTATTTRAIAQLASLLVKHVNQHLHILIALCTFMCTSYFDDTTY